MKTSITGAHRRSRLLPGALVALALFAGAAPLAAANIDLVVMVDTSESMFPYFDDLMNYLVHDMLTEKLHPGDTFHLLSFSSVPEVEISLALNSVEAAQRAFGRILLLHALGRYTDLVAALQFLSTYVKELPATNPKQIILITDGVHDPPPGSPSRGSPESVQSAVQETTAAMAKEGWSFNILRVPPDPAPGDDHKSYLSDIARSLDVAVVPYKASDKEYVTGQTTGYPNLTFPPSLGNVGSRFKAPFRVKNWKVEPIIVRLSSITSDGAELLENKVSITVGALAEVTLDAPIRLPLSYPPGDHQARVQLTFEDDLRISPTAGALAFTYTGKGGFPIPRLLLLYVLYIVLGLGVIYLLVRLFLYMRKKIREAPVAGMEKRQPTRGKTAPTAPVESRSSAAGPPGRPGRKLVPLLPQGSAARSPAIPARRVRPTVTSLRRSLPRARVPQASLPPLIELRVSLQNHRIGFRNVHRIKPGSAHRVGGRFSSYLVFLVPVPASIGEIRNDSGRYSFTPLRSELFPGLEGPVEDCLDREIPFVTPKGMELTLHFREWVSPLEEINNLLRQS